MNNLLIKNFSSQIALLQMENMNEHRIKTYLKSIRKNSIVAFGEYVLNPFFSLIENIKEEEINGNNEKNIAFLKDVSREFGHCIIAPIIDCKDNLFYKNLVVIHEELILRYEQQKLISFSHWNEKTFFSNKISTTLNQPFIFKATIENEKTIHIGAMFGYEAHFDELWVHLKKWDVDVVIIPTVSTFESKNRWQSLFNSHSFTNSCYVFRINRIGNIMNRGFKWEFYGNSFSSFGGDLLDSLDREEGMLCCNIDIDSLESIKNEWGFRI